MTTQAPGKPPGFPVAKIQKERDRLYDLVARFAGKAPAGEVFDQLRQALAAAYALSPDAPAVFETVRALPPGPLAAKTLWLFAWRVASRHARLKKGEPIRPWTNQLQDEWTPFEIMDVEYRRTDRFGAGLMVTLRALAGTCCGMTVTKFWSNDQMSMHLRRLGFTHKGKARLPYKSMKQLVRLRLVALVSAEHSDEKPRFRGYEVVGGILAFNKKLLKARILRKPPCPMNYSHPCHVCPIGYALGSPTCPASVHPATWEYKSCPECGSDGWFDPVKPSEACIQCRQNMAARKAEAAPSR